jgi:PAS domain S-box-containing protein
LLRSAFDNAPIGMSVVAPDGQWLRVNDAYCRMLGYEREELIGSRFRHLMHPDDVSESDEFIAAVVAAERSSLERDLRYLHRDGSIVWVHVRSEVIRDRAGEALYAISHLQDVTDHQRMKERLAALFESAADGMVIVDGGGEIVLVNEKTEELFGYRRAELVGQRVEILVPDRVRDGHVAHRAAFSADPQARPMSLRLDLAGRRKDGSEFPIEISLGPFETEAGALVAITISDITERRRSEERLRDGERTLRSMIDNTPALVYVKGRDFRYQLVNREFEEVFGVRSDWMVGRRDEDILPASAVEQVRAKDRIVLDGARLCRRRKRRCVTVRSGCS